MTDTTDLIERLRDCAALSPRDKDRHEAADALEAQARKIDELRNALACEMDDTRNACGALNSEVDRLKSRLAAAERERDEAHRLWAMDRKRLAEAERNEGTLLGMIHHQRDVLRECLPYINESMAGRRPGRCADDIRAAVKALTADSASAVQPERCCLDYPRCDCNSPPEPDDDWLCFQRPAQPKVTP